LPNNHYQDIQRYEKLTIVKIKKIIRQLKSFTLPALLGALCMLASCDSDGIRNRKHVATVNGEKIYLDEYRDRLNAQKGILSPKAFPDSRNKQKLLEEEILDSMVTEKIVLQRARELNLSVSKAELDGKLMDIRKDYGNNFFDLLRAQNVQYEDWCEELKKEMLLDKLVSAFRKTKRRVTFRIIPAFAGLKHVSGRRRLSCGIRKRQKTLRPVWIKVRILPSLRLQNPWDRKLHAEAIWD
jgi:hypothetical protein